LWRLTNPQRRAVASPKNRRALACHAVILSGAKNLALDFSAEKEQGEMLRCAQHDSERAPRDEVRRWCYSAAFGRNRRPSFHCPAVAGRLKKWCGNSFQCPSARHGGAIGNRKSAIPATVGQAMIVENLRRTRRR